jgi:hypothetical protein
VWQFGASPCPFSAHLHATTMMGCSPCCGGRRPKDGAGRYAPVGQDIDIEEESLPTSTELATRAAAARHAPRWVPDAYAPSCMLCEMVFWWVGPMAWTWHHCRSCGWVVCLACMPKDQVLPLGRWVSSTTGHPLKCGAPMKEQRVCNSCVLAARVAAEVAAEVVAEVAALWLELTDIDEVLVNICHFLGLWELGWLACVAWRFMEPTLTELGGAQLLSPIEEGAWLWLEVVVAGGGGSGGGSGASGGAVVVLWLVDETWVWALWRVESHLLFTSCGPEVVLGEEGALRLRVAERGQWLRHGAWGWRALGPPRWLAFTRELAVCAAVGVLCCARGALRVVATCRPSLLSV